MEFIMGILLGIAVYALTWPALIGLLIIGVIFEANDAHAWAMFTGIVSAVIAYFFFHIDPMSIIMYVIAYFVIGFVWCAWRYKRYANDIVEKFKNSNKYERQSAVARLHPTRMLDKLTTWVIVWPFSVVENFTGDFIKLVQIGITKIFKGVFHRIYEVAVNQLLPKEDEVEEDKVK